ncbi:copper chaperone PCu(A)C [Pimelobacter simplex]|uniref:Copper metallochaperone, Cox17-like n=1 Tax=Nocardioides simplex TaxID=2045 RepID=A0A0A1DMI7_NOCSI|nr:copper chaperone PCu(A)C [Pimelobacter simplex]AIY16590.1 Copper metallochaperone, Cox17-like [Pimelobacter simplex]MCG8153990.1 copper chaperone PCu(A)C [Pimelobacter simplex]GEB15399.1 hypothetical protein NSI01_37140 [Pimelobacter simplex]SFN14588.1 hypothetical protein SAMN05421671_5392 [Pimelobacter simplex]
MKKHLTAAVLAAALVPALAACGSGSEDARDQAPTSGSSPAAKAALTVTDPWVKAAPSGMTAAFGTLVNEGSSDVTVVAATTSVNDTTELHETVENEDGSMAMRPKEGGFVIPAGGSLALEPGGDHLMLMGLTEPVEAGTTVTITLTLGDGTTTDVEATVKAFDGADEKYQNGGEH